MLICAHHLKFSYGDNLVLHHVDLDVEKGDYLVIAGANGSGKSTLLSGLVGLKKPASGIIHYEYDRATRGLGYMPQQHGLQKNFPASVEEIARTGLLGRRGWNPFFSKTEKKEVLMMLHKLRIGGLAKENFGSLSGGQQQRVLLARALLASSELIIMDEPTAGLDPIITREFYDLLREIHQQGVTIVMVSHDLSLALEHATKVLYLEDGRGTLYTKKEFHASEQGRKVVGDDRRNA